MTLKKILLEHLHKQGNISLSAYMDYGLNHEIYGYYKHKSAIGRAGDFITAPEISQVFGELVGIWLINQWVSMGKPTPFVLCELGPGRGVLMSDILRACRLEPDFINHCKIIFIEQNQTLINEQHKRVPNAEWLPNLDRLPNLPTVFIANEFFDALPIDAYHRRQNQFFKSHIIYNEAADIFEMAWLPSDTAPSFMPKDVDYFEFSSVSGDYMNIIAEHISEHKGCGLFIDYGYIAPPNRLTVRGFANHKVCSILDNAGDIDMTADVNFHHLQSSVQHYDCPTFPVLTQAEFLSKLGAKQRTDILCQSTQDSNIRNLLQTGLQKLTSADEMGEKFKVMAVFSQDVLHSPYPFQRGVL